MSVKLTEEQVLDIHLNYHANGGKDSLYTLSKRHGITTNETYSVLSRGLHAALSIVKRGHKFSSYESGETTNTTNNMRKDAKYRQDVHMFGG